MDRRLLLSLLASLALAATLGCQPSPAEIADGEDSLAALRASAPTSRYKEPYWAEQCHRGNVTWQKALAFCRAEGRDGTRYPNCEHVRIVSRWDETPPMPASSFRFGDIPAVREAERQLPPPSGTHDDRAPGRGGDGGHRPAPPASAGERP